MTLLSRNDLPVRYLPATDITPTLSLIELKNVFASSDTLNYSILLVKLETYSFPNHNRLNESAEVEVFKDQSNSQMRDANFPLIQNFHHKLKE